MFRNNYHSGPSFYDALIKCLHLFRLFFKDHIHLWIVMAAQKSDRIDAQLFARVLWSRDIGS